jgi:hypothetical protein
LNKQELEDFIENELKKTKDQLSISISRLQNIFSSNEITTLEERQEYNMVHYYQGMIDGLNRVKSFIEQQVD